MALTIIQHIYRIPARTRLMISLFVAFLTLMVSGRTPPSIQFILVWCSFAFTGLVLFWITILTAKVSEVKEIAKKQDSSRTFVFFSCISLL